MTFKCLGLIGEAEENGTVISGQKYDFIDLSSSLRGLLPLIARLATRKCAGSRTRRPENEGERYYGRSGDIFSPCDRWALQRRIA
jgi:hypothetical protein